MRKIALQIVQAICDGKTRKIGNTIYDHESGEVRLYGHRILYQINNQLWLIDWAICKKYPTNTTCSRVNDIVNQMTNYGFGTRIYRKNFLLQLSSHMGDQPLASDIRTQDPIAFSL